MFDPMYFIIVGPAMMLALWAQYKLKSTYKKYAQIGTMNGYSGADAARIIMEKEGIYDVRIEMTQGQLSDHYDPREKVLRLSPDVYQGNSIASVGIAAHEVGHAVQHATAYPFLALRSAFVPVASIGSGLAMPLIFIGFLLMSMTSLHGLGQIAIIAGIGFFSMAVLFQVITLPVEFDASSRAKTILETCSITRGPDEADGVNRVLGAAAMTYVAATATAVSQLLYFLLLASGGRRN